jgi:hypothetical protein
MTNGWKLLNLFLVFGPFSYILFMQKKLLVETIAL